MANALSLHDYYNILDYHNVKRPDSIHKSKKKALELMHKNMCICQYNKKKFGKIQKILSKVRSKSKNKKNYNSRTVKNNCLIFLISKKSTRNVSPVSLLFNHF